MLTIGPVQMEALHSQMLRTQEERVARTIQSLFPEQANQLIRASEGSEDKFRSAIRNAAKRAQEYGITDESDVAAFLTLAFARSRFKDDWKDFFEACRPIVESEELAGPAKMALIEHRLRREAAADERAALVSGMITQLRGTG